MKTHARTTLLSVLLIVCWAVMPAQAQPPLPPDLTELTLQQLMTIKVTTVSKREEILFNAAAAAYVITGEEIRRAGVRSIPEALRMAPGVDVAQLDANKWAISIRGFNGRFSNKLLVLIDGRSVYTPLFAGVFWDVQDTLLEDIDRIEVIRGPGSTLWGANAVNGVINIITKKASTTQGGYVEGGGGTEERGFGSVRYGGEFAEGGFYRAYAKYFRRDRFITQAGRDGADDWEAFRGGFRTDWDLSAHDSLTVQGDMYRGTYGQTTMIASLLPPFSETSEPTNTFSGGNMLARWRHRLAERSETVLQLYYDRTHRNESLFREDRDTVDLDFQHHVGLGARHDVVWGVDARLSFDDIEGSSTISFTKSNRMFHRVGGFMQDQITLIEDRLFLTLGTKVEHALFSGFQVQPSARLLWTPADGHAVWAAVSRAVRTPSRGEVDVRSNALTRPPDPTDPSGLPTLFRAIGSRDFGSEEVIASEIGYRVKPTDWVMIDVAGFYNIYNNLRTSEPGTPFLSSSPAPPHIEVPLRVDNKLAGRTVGVEIATTWRPVSFWKLQLNYSFLDIHLDPDPSSRDTVTKTDEGLSPRHQVQLLSHLNLPWRLQFDTAAYFVDRLPTFDLRRYLRLDVRLGWRPTPAFEINLVGQNLLEGSHREFGTILGDVINTTRVQRSVLVYATWRF
ncbi:MAG: TonB-dependent receptor [Candidatus Methylomirabilis oxyfera]|nr:TonB-dependent receptor [Candidatus Methylomirabilis oxyfera]